MTCHDRGAPVKIELEVYSRAEDMNSVDKALKAAEPFGLQVEVVCAIIANVLEGESIPIACLEAMIEWDV